MKLIKHGKHKVAFIFAIFVLQLWAFFAYYVLVIIEY
jgi:hypothetical protein